MFTVPDLKGSSRKPQWRERPRLEDLESRALLSGTATTRFRLNALGLMVSAAGLAALAAGTIPATRLAAAEPRAPDLQQALQRLADREVALPTAINAYRLSQGLPIIPLSFRLTMVADTHIADWVKHKNEIQALGCDFHGWSKPVDGEPWKTFGCVAGNDHVMWDKPKEITGYPRDGYEIARGNVSSAQEALDRFKESVLHRDVILNQGRWKNKQWQALGAAVGDGLAFAWFGEQLDDPPAAMKASIAGQWASNFGQVGFNVLGPSIMGLWNSPWGTYWFMGTWRGSELGIASLGGGVMTANLFLSPDGQALMGWVTVISSTGNLFMQPCFMQKYPGGS